MELKPLFDYIAQFIQLTAEEQSILESKIKIRKFLKAPASAIRGGVRGNKKSRFSNGILFKPDLVSFHPSNL